MTLNSFIENLITIDVGEYVGDFRWYLDRWLESHGVPVILTADLQEVNHAWYAMRYRNKVGDENPIKELANCFNMFGGPRGTYVELSWAIKDIRDGVDYQYWLVRRWFQESGGSGPSPILHINRKMSSTSHKHLRSMWNLYTDLLIRGKDNDAKIVREAINVAEQNELDAVGKYWKL